MPTSGCSFDRNIEQPTSNNEQRMERQAFRRMNHEEINFEALWLEVISQFPDHLSHIHGPDHWARVEANGLMLAQKTGADPVVVRLFSLFHDSRRENDDHDPDHGRRGADFAELLLPRFTTLSA